MPTINKIAWAVIYFALLYFGAQIAEAFLTA